MKKVQTKKGNWTIDKGFEKEIKALERVFKILNPLRPEQRNRVLRHLLDVENSKG